MLFNDINFFYFLIAVFATHWALRRSRWQNPFLLVSSWYFYMQWDQRFLILILVSTFVDYIISLKLDNIEVPVRKHIFLVLLLLCSFPLLLHGNVPLIGGSKEFETDFSVGTLYTSLIAGLIVFYLLLIFCSKLAEPVQRKGLLLLSVAVNLGILGFFKYFNFFIESFSDFLLLFGYQANTETLNIILPVGISFYTFQTMAHTIDVYRKKTQACKEFIPFALYVAYFPQLLAGPIERSGKLIPQIVSEKKMDFEEIGAGVRLILWGLFLKLWVADSVAMVSNYIFGISDINGGFGGSGYAALVGTLAFSFQIYGDFAGYSNIARGVSRLLGIRLSRNFRMPYFSRNPSEFWQRWHITLSSWLRDYLYIPLGGNRYGQLVTARNLMTTMVLGGLWHGASFNFLVWGAGHGIWLGAYHSMKNRLEKIRPSIGFTLLSVVLTFVIVNLLWIFFRSPTLIHATSMLSSIFTSFSAGEDTKSITYMLRFVLIHALPLLVVQIVNRHKDDEVIFDTWPYWGKVTLYLFLLLFINAASNQQTEFIYFQF